MIVAVTYENGEVFQHFGRTAEFKVYDVEDGRVVSSRVVSTEGHGHGELVGVLRGLGATVLICGGLGEGARSGLASVGIRVLSGNSGFADDAVEAFLAGRIAEDPGATCRHHDHHGDHGCTTCHQ